MDAARRKLLGTSALSALAAFFGGHTARALATIEDVERAIRNFTSNADAQTSEALSLELPDVAVNGNSVPIAVRVLSPMSAHDYVDSVMLLAPENPNVEVITFHFTPMSGRAQVATRIRLAKSQTLVAVAKTSTGNFYRTEQAVEVTIGGCGS